MNDPRFDLIPSDPAKHIDRLVRDLAWGVLNNKWQNAFHLQGIPAWRDLKFTSDHEVELTHYLTNVWSDRIPDLVLLQDLGYIVEVQSEGDDTSLYRLTNKALKLGRSAVPSSIFISYRRTESSSFALLLSERLKTNGIAPFLDNQPDIEDQGISLKPGGKWRSDLKDAIESREWFIILIGPTTLNSDAVKQELDWALASHKKIIPIWHRGFDLNNKAHFPDNLSASIREVISETNAIQVISEDPHQYEVAIGNLLSICRIAP